MFVSVRFVFVNEKRPHIPQHNQRNYQNYEPKRVLVGRNASIHPQPSVRVASAEIVEILNKEHGSGEQEHA
jgi:hypothetical protein